MTADKIESEVEAQAKERHPEVISRLIERFNEQETSKKDVILLHSFWGGHYIKYKVLSIEKNPDPLDKTKVDTVLIEVIECVMPRETYTIGRKLRVPIGIANHWTIVDQ